MSYEIDEDKIGLEIRRILGIPEPGSVERLKTIAAISAELIELACARGKAAGLTLDEAIGAYRIGLLGLEKAVRVIATAASVAGTDVDKGNEE